MHFGQILKKKKYLLFDVNLSNQSETKDPTVSWKPPEGRECPPVLPARCRDGRQWVVVERGLTLNAAHLVNSSNYGGRVSLMMMMMIRGVLKGLQRAKCAASLGASGTCWRASACVSGAECTHTNRLTCKYTHRSDFMPT